MRTMIKNTPKKRTKNYTISTWPQGGYVLEIEIHNPGYNRYVSIVFSDWEIHTYQETEIHTLQLFNGKLTVGRIFNPPGYLIKELGRIKAPVKLCPHMVKRRRGENAYKWYCTKFKLRLYDPDNCKNGCPGRDVHE